MSAFKNSLVNENSGNVFMELKCAAKVNLIFGIFRKIMKMESVKDFLQTKTIQLWKFLNLFIMESIDINKLEERPQKVDISDICTCERSITKWSFHNLTNKTVFASLTKGVPMGCKCSVLPEPILTKPNVNCFNFERNSRQLFNDNFCLFKAPAEHSYGKDKLEGETSKNFNRSFIDSGEAGVSKFQGVHRDDVPKVEDLLRIEIFLTILISSSENLLANLLVEFSRSSKKV